MLAAHVYVNNTKQQTLSNTKVINNNTCSGTALSSTTTPSSRSIRTPTQFTTPTDTVCDGDYLCMTCRSRFSIVIKKNVIIICFNYVQITWPVCYCFIFIRRFLLSRISPTVRISSCRQEA